MRERLQGIAESASSAPRLASSSATSFPGRNESPGTHSRLTEEEEREDSSCQRVSDKRNNGGQDRVARTERESDNRRDEKWQTCWCCRDQQRARRMANASAKKLEYTGPAEKERVASVSQREKERAVGKYVGAAFSKRKRNKAVCPEYQIMRGEAVKVSESRITEREGQIKELVDGQNPGSEAPPRSKKGPERREQRKCQGRNDCQRSDGEEWVCQGHCGERRSEEMTQSNTSSPWGRK